MRISYKLNVKMVKMFTRFSAFDRFYSMLTDWAASITILTILSGDIKPSRYRS